MINIFKKNIIIIFLTIISNVCFANEAKMPLNAGSPAITGDTQAPFGWHDFCRKYPDECQEQKADPERIQLTADLWKSIRQFNEWANHGIEPVSDMDHWGLVESWDIPVDGKGDCEDYALLKRKALMRFGLPQSALLITVVYNRRQEGHAVLTAVTDHGDLILDNQTDLILGWQQTGYRFIERQSSYSPNRWVRLNDHADEIIVSSRKETFNEIVK